MESLADKVLKKQLYSRKDVLTELEISDIELENTLLSKNTRHLQEFKLRQRALHVIKGFHYLFFLSVHEKMFNFIRYISYF